MLLEIGPNPTALADYPYPTATGKSVLREKLLMGGVPKPNIGIERMRVTKRRSIQHLNIGI